MPRPLTPEEVSDKLSDAGPGSLVFVSYHAGREPTAKAIVEAHRATVVEKIPRRLFVGELCRVWTTKVGDRVFRIYTETRDTLQSDGSLSVGNFRTYNPLLGEVLSLEVLDKKPLTWPE